MDDKPDLRSVLTDFVYQEQKAILFAGAGVSARAGLPTWNEYLRQIGELIRSHDAMTRHHMAERLHEKDLLGAAGLYYLSNKVPQAEKFQNLAVPLKDFDAVPLRSLVSLPFSAIVTTNYDRALMAANVSICRDAEEVNYRDPSLAAAPFNERYYVARIHGRVEVPETIRLSSQHYDELRIDTHYQDFLAELFSRRRILFIGFSFLDPAIHEVLKIVEAKVGKHHRGSHLALLPNDADPALDRQLALFAIKRVSYDPQNGHDELWEAIAETAASRSSAGGTPPESTTVPTVTILDPFALTRKYLSACYARNSLRSKSIPLRQAIVEGMVAKLVCDAGQLGTMEPAIKDVIARELTLTTEDAGPLIDAAVLSLVGDGLVTRSGTDGALITTKKFAEKPLNQGINLLVDGVMNRIVVRSGGADSPRVRKFAGKVFEYVVTHRGFDLGAAFAAREVPTEVDIASAVRHVCATALPPGDQFALMRAADELIRQPTKSESLVLVELGRAGFALELIGRAARDTLFHSLTLPERIYLDANVLMPAITPGHPLAVVYQRTLDQLVKASASALSSVEIVAYHGFLNEIVSHRRLAVQALQELDPRRLRREMLLFGGTNVNVYVAGFANTLSNEPGLTFDNYLSRVAPFSTEQQLAKWLKIKGIQVKEDPEMKYGADEYPDILHKLEVANSNGRWNQKEGIVVLHDAVQIAALSRDLRLGRRAIFVSADQRLKENLRLQGLSSPGNAMISHVALAQMVDLLVGAQESDRGFTTMLWGYQTSKDTEQIRNYLINLALDSYDAAMAMQMSSIVDGIAEDAFTALGKNGVSLAAGSEAERSKVLAVMDGFEDKFFQNMREAIERERRKQDS